MKDTTSLALYYSRPDGPIEIKPTLLPNELQPHEILVSVSALELSHLDAKLKRFSQVTRTHFAGRSFCGKVVGVGSHVEHLKVDDRVCGCFRALTHSYIGTWTVFDTKDNIVFKAPKYLSDSQAATFPISFGTAWELVFNRTPNLDRSSKALVLGGGTPVGYLTIQILQKLFNLHHITVACTEQSVEKVRDLGITRVIDTSQNLAHALVESVGGEEKYTVIYDCIGGAEPLGVWPTILKSKTDGGVYLTIRGDAPELNKSESIHSLVRNAAPYVPRNLARLALGRFVGIDYHFVTWSDVPFHAVDYATKNELLSLDSKTWNINQVQEAFEYLQSLETGGRVVIDMTSTPRDIQECGSDCIEDKLRYSEYLNYSDQAKGIIRKSFYAFASAWRSYEQNAASPKSSPETSPSISNKVEMDDHITATPATTPEEATSSLSQEASSPFAPNTPYPTEEDSGVKDPLKGIKKLFKKRDYQPLDTGSPISDIEVASPGASPKSPRSPKFNLKEWIQKKKSKSKSEREDSPSPAVRSPSSPADTLAIAIEAAPVKSN